MSFAKRRSTASVSVPGGRSRVAESTKAPVSSHGPDSATAPRTPAYRSAASGAAANTPSRVSPGQRGSPKRSSVVTASPVAAAIATGPPWASWAGASTSAAPTAASTRAGRSHRPTVNAAPRHPGSSPVTRSSRARSSSVSGLHRSAAFINDSVTRILPFVGPL